ncbi:MAG: acyl-CoA thioesterase [gamma proteobacterium symbiont of Stewartia floridana]|uniref:Acyl-CoA thioesterase n=1 Tax=Candidatus Thiodiazotropha taylori TaxID=2792791 RepID=A0A9E4T6X5_9GAMM|nr:acyl-CoA thioesterase [Candidatus Thiodiazotropha taylori]MCG7963832.1 acyl-CoA thioesterase [Candidatus Thiodiazotropha endolucinida]RLW56249.1 MAG: acyl-CoA thioesterase [gamma proteobacterium symbiont of Stewartia floridana]MCG7893009.1 acyl-CoA thioesterase [Candidatus Thiodiazotropha taylori]MCG7910651.1 acyl-CoA thioesterase [Candidatus Thiodiazotropha taylori]
MENHKLVLPQHLNQYGYLFGGNLLKWVDEYAWIAAVHDYPGRHFVTIGLDRVTFHRSVREGAILRFDIQQSKQGDSSVDYRVKVFAEESVTGQEESVFSTTITFVCLDEAGNKTSI